MEITYYKINVLIFGTKEMGSIDGTIIVHCSSFWY